MIRMIKAYSLGINRNKWGNIKQIVRAYADEKNDHLFALNDASIFATYDKQEQYRDALIDIGYVSPSDLQARMWKFALKDGYETILKNWANLAVDLRSRVAKQKDWTQEQKYYANWLLKSERRITELISDKAPINDKIQINIHERKQVQNYLRREIRRHRSYPQVKSVRSFSLDADMYDTFIEDGSLYIKIMTLVKGKRLVIPLTGEHAISGNIRIVLDRDKRRIEVHYTADVDIPKPLTNEPTGLDAGLTEVFTDDEGIRYGIPFGVTLLNRSNQLNAKGKKRNKLHKLERKYRSQGKFKKANRIKKFNLGTRKQEKKSKKFKVEVNRQINTAINEVIDTKQPSVIVAEKLNFKGKAQSKQMSRRVSSLVTGVLDERIEFKALARGSSHKQVNPAYSSQTCPMCGWVDPKNRTGDTFQCQKCRHIDESDRVAAHNLKARLNDPDITLYTPKERVKTILFDRFNVRLREIKGNQDRSVSDWTPELHTQMSTSQSESETTGTIKQKPGARYDHHV